MSIYSGDQAKFYDLIHSEKRYDLEAQFLIDLHKIHSSKKPKKILDVGCGTGSHTIEFAKKGYNILGIDLASDMIQIAEEKYKNKNIKFLLSDVTDVDNTFDLSFSFFNVINHILNLEDLISFLKGIKSSLNKGGLYMFDCYNGIATILDNPRYRLTEKYVGEHKLIIETSCENNDFRETLVLKNKIKIKDKIFKYSIKHRLWKPEFLRDIIKYVGLDVLNIYKAFDLKEMVKKEDDKIVFVCKLN